MHPFAKSSLLLGPLLLGASCTFHSTATHWNGRVGTSGKPVFVKSSTNVAFNLAIVLPFLGRTSMDEMIDGTSNSIAENGGDKVRLVETGSENYWYGFPPFTWVFTPVITEIAIEYEPSVRELSEVMAEEVAMNRAPKRYNAENRDEVITTARR